MRWETFEIQELFDIQDGYYNKKPPMTDMEIPFIGASENNYGITGFTDINSIKNWDKVGMDNDNSLKNKLFGPNCFAVTNNGSVGNVYFMETKYTSSHDVTTLYLKEDIQISKELGLFIATLLKNAGKPFSYGRKWRPKRMKKTKILIPVTSNNMPDWDYMEQYIVNIIKTIRIPKIETIKPSSLDLHSVEWMPFMVSDLFDINKEPGSENNMAALEKGNTPLISARKFNNGLKDFVNVKQTKIKSSHTITWNKDGDGGAGLAFYQPYRFAVDSHVFVLYPKTYMSKESMFFITTLLSRYKDIFNHGLANNQKRFKVLQIMLPITDKKNINWQFMEDYIKSISNSHLI